MEKQGDIMTEDLTRKGPWIATYSDRRFYFDDPRPEDIDIADIAHALSNICRFTGHVRRFYSVAEHSWHASFLVPPEDALEALLHDAHEAYVSDCSSPLKAALGQTYRHLDGAAHFVVAIRFGIRTDLPASVKLADLQMLFREARVLMATPVEEWEIVEPPTVDVQLHCFAPETAEAVFLARFEELTKLRAMMSMIDR
jgi:hypothetical protein